MGSHPKSSSARHGKKASPLHLKSAPPITGTKHLGDARRVEAADLVPRLLPLRDNMVSVPSPDAKPPGRLILHRENGRDTDLNERWRSGSSKEGVNVDRGSFLKSGATGAYTGVGLRPVRSRSTLPIGRSPRHLTNCRSTRSYQSCSSHLHLQISKADRRERAISHRVRFGLFLHRPESPRRSRKPQRPMRERR